MLETHKADNILLAGGLCHKSSSSGDNRKANLDDRAILTGGEVITEELGFTLDKVTIFIDGTIILHGGSDKKLIEERCEEGDIWHMSLEA
ncbi:hypothetical protein PIB30_095893 [Stylosanthes scabra]|uniref:Uncharacterized protein n=1 Tax=Stylosanthes scabra TaxID=79078 RepID=A0ABU6XTQ0_9FABA|nr:hypothetical protein [Stylosanthes scabra]